MPSIIPYDPSLALGQLVKQDKLELLAQISTLQAPADAAEDALNGLIQLKESLTLTATELLELATPEAAAAMQGYASSVGTAIVAQGAAYAGLKVAALMGEFALKTKTALVTEAQTALNEVIKATKIAVPGVGGATGGNTPSAGIIGISWESPIDYNKSQLKRLPLSSDTMKMSVQFFAFNANTQTSTDIATTVSSYVASATKVLGQEHSQEAKASVRSAVSAHYEQHDIVGTLVVSVVCTHRNASVFAPYALDVDKAINVWNALHANRKDQQIDTNTPMKLAATAVLADVADTSSPMNIISGVTYGSCFVGMVHILRTSSTAMVQEMVSAAASLQEQAKVGLCMGYEEGGFGISSTFSSNFQAMLSTAMTNSTCTLTTIGVIPSITSNEVANSVKAITDFDPAKTMKQLADYQNAVASDMDSMQSAATAARTGGQMVALQTARITAAMSSLQDIDMEKNKVIDTNSMMTALEDYIRRCNTGDEAVGAPINFYIKPITREELIQAFIKKYYPMPQVVQLGADDLTDNPSNPTPAPAPSNPS